MRNQEKIVEFWKWCQKCKYNGASDSYGSTCDECLSNPVNTNSHKPVKWEAIEGRK